MSKVEHATSLTTNPERVIRSDHFMLAGKNEGGSNARIESAQNVPISSLDPQVLQKKSVKKAHPRSISVTVLILLMTVLSGALVLIILLQLRISSHNGMAVPSSNQFVRRIILSYIPTAFATLLEPTWAMLIRDPCFLEPFKLLMRGNAAMKVTLAARLTSSPPQFAIYEAIRVRRYVLAFLCVVSLSTSTWGVVMSGLFQTIPTDTPQPAAFEQIILPSIRNTPLLVGSTNFQSDTAYSSSQISAYDFFYTMDHSIGTDSRYPPWTTAHSFLFPLDFKKTTRHPMSVKCIKPRLKALG